MDCFDDVVVVMAFWHWAGGSPPALFIAFEKGYVYNVLHFQMLLDCKKNLRNYVQAIIIIKKDIHEFPMQDSWGCGLLVQCHFCADTSSLNFSNFEGPALSSCLFSPQGREIPAC